MGGVDLVVISAGTGHLNDELDWPLEYEAIKTNVIGFTAMVNVAIKHFMEKGSIVYITRRWRLVAWLLKLLPGFIYERL